MHAYATDEDRTRAILYLAVASAALGSAAGYLLSLFGNSLPHWLTAPSTMTVFGMLFWIFNRYAWAWHVRSARPSKIPDLRGTWAGVVHSSHDNRDTPVTVYIRQTWLRISVRLESERSASASVMAALNTDEAPAEQGLNYEYLNEPVATALPTMHIHRGTAHLRVSPDGTTLEGNYYSGRDRTNVGTIRLRKVCTEPLPRAEALKRLVELGGAPPAPPGGGPSET
jgi:hypothetical protein